MFIVNLIGGLGNQMFQYAFGRSLANNRKLLVKFDTTELLDRTPKQDFTYRDFELGIFKGEVPVATALEVALFKHHSQGLAEKIFYGGRRRLRQAKMYYEAQYFQYDPNVWKTGVNTYFHGYWQNEQYFHSHEALVRRELAFRHGPTGQNALLAQQIQTQNAISVHIRRGDYVSNSVANQVHGTCSPSYYEEAVRYITARVTNPQLYIFSDEPDWVRQNMTFEVPATYVAHNHGSSSFEDMRLMSLCQHNIIANSSFSWWGAWLNANPNKLVVAPKQWMLTEQVDSSGLIPRTWIRI